MWTCLESCTILILVAFLLIFPCRIIDIDSDVEELTIKDEREFKFNPAEAPKQESIEENETKAGDEVHIQSILLQVK